MQLAQIAHHREDMEAAFAVLCTAARTERCQAYTNAAKQDQSSVRPLFGLAQCHIWRKQLGHAVQCLEKVLEMAPRSWEPKRLLGILYSRYCVILEACCDVVAGSISLKLGSPCSSSNKCWKCSQTTQTH